VLEKARASVTAGIGKGCRGGEPFARSGRSATSVPRRIGISPSAFPGFILICPSRCRLYAVRRRGSRSARLPPARGGGVGFATCGTRP